MKTRSPGVNPYLDFALPLAQKLGFYISPPIPVGRKHPVFCWKEFQSSPAQYSHIKYWSSLTNKFNQPHGYGILTGPYSGFVIVEADSKEAVKLLLEKCPATPLVQRSGSRRGLHFVFRYPSDPDCYVQTCSRIEVDGVAREIDIRGVGGLAVGPGSLHKSGNRYETLGDWLSVDLEAVPRFDPAWLDLDATPPPKKLPEATGDANPSHLSARQQLASEWLITCPGAREGNGAEGYAFALACELVHGFALSPEEALPPFIKWGEKNDQLSECGGWFPWDEKVLYRKLCCAADKSDLEDRPDGFSLPFWVKLDTAEFLAVIDAN